MNDVNHRRTAIIAYAGMLGAALVFPLSAVLVSHWCFHVSLPTLMFISFVLLFLGGFFCYPIRGDEEPDMTSPSEDVRSSGSILLLIGQASGLGVLILFIVRLLSQGMLFSWT